jgi:hypothetical protein
VSETADLETPAVPVHELRRFCKPSLQAHRDRPDNTAMPRLRADRRLTAALFAVCLVPATAAAEPGSLRLPTITASAAAAADWVSTYHAVKHYKIRETNPLLSPFAHSPEQLVAAGALIDAAALTTWNLTVGKKKPRLAAAGLWAMTAFRAYLVVHNMRNTQKAAPR